MCRCFEYFIGTIMIYSLFPSVPFIAPCVTPYGSTVTDTVRLKALYLTFLICSSFLRESVVRSSP